MYTIKKIIICLDQNFSDFSVVTKPQTSFGKDCIESL